MLALASHASDHFRLFDNRRETDPSLLATRKVTSWDTKLEVIGWEVDMAGMTITLSPAKLAKLRDSLRQWPEDQVSASDVELRSLTGKLLHVCEVVRPGKFFIRRMLNQLWTVGKKAVEGQPEDATALQKHNLRADPRLSFRCYVLATARRRRTAVKTGCFTCTLA